MLLLSLIFYLKYEAPTDEQNLPMVMELLRAGEVREDDYSYGSPLDELFDRLEICLLYTSNAVFVGKDETGTPKYAAYRGLGSSTFKGDASGSDKRYSCLLYTAQKLRDHSYQPNPARRVYIAKKNSSKKRPLGIPSTDDKLLHV